MIIENEGTHQRLPCVKGAVILPILGNMTEGLSVYIAGAVSLQTFPYRFRYGISLSLRGGESPPTIRDWLPVFVTRVYLLGIVIPLSLPGA